MNNGYNNYGLFDKYLNKVKTGTVAKFGSFGSLQSFLHHLAEQGNLLLAIKAQASVKITSLEVAKLIKSDKYLAKCIALAQDCATEAVEAVLYDRAINGYEELTYNKEGECIARKKKYCSKSLLEYLKANSTKYHPPGSKVSKSSITSKKAKGCNRSSEGNNQSMPSFEIESYE
jgi:hypothetical protein